MLKNLVILNVMCVCSVIGDAGTDYNEVNSDGSFAFGLSNDDIGGHYHTATGSPNKIIRGRYGSRNPETGRIEETVYTAGPRGFRARGPSIHRHMDLSQYPPGPIGTPDDPLADPYDDPSYDFNYRTGDSERREEADSTGRVRGLYSYLDDIGERHTVRYAAGAGTGFEVLNSVPDTPASVAYNSPLYKAPRKTRGRMSVQRGPDGQYKFILSGPDQRRSETSGPDGIVRGSYSYLDDKGIQRTVQYIAGPGIGYRVVKNVIGPGTHVSPGAALSPTYGIRDFQTNDLSDDGYLRTAESGRIRPKDDSLDSLERDEDNLAPGSRQRPSDDGDYRDSSRRRGEERTRPVTSGDIVRGRGRPISGDYDKESGYSTSSRKDGSSSGRRRLGQTVTGSRKESSENGDSRPVDRDRESGVSTKSGSEEMDRTSEGTGKNDLDSSARDFGGYEYGKGTGGRGKEVNFSSRDYADGQFGRKTGSSSSSDRGSDDNQNRDSFSSRRRKPTFEDDSRTTSRGRGPENRLPGSRSSADRRPVDHISGYDYDTDFPLVTNDRRRLESDRNQDWSARGRDSTVIKNIGKWYVGLPPGSAVRAHVQSIDLLPLGGRAAAPSEALLRDELKAT